MARKLSILAFLLTLTGLVPAAETLPTQPVFIVLYSRFYDHSQPFPLRDRLERLLPLIGRLRVRYPELHVSAMLQFSGTTAQVFAEDDGAVALRKMATDLGKQGAIEFGYTGEDEPSYLYRPKPNLLTAETPEDRWKTRAAAAERFLNDYKNPVTGQPVEGLTGGLRRVQELFGESAYISGLTTTIGADTPAVYEARKMNRIAVMSGIVPSDPRFGISGYEPSASEFTKVLSPEPATSPEVYWQDNVLRLSPISLLDHAKYLSTDDDPAALKKAFQNLDRSRVRVIRLEIGGYLRYLSRRSDGSLKADPLEWMYFHPDEPTIPSNMKPLVDVSEVIKGNKNEDAALKWLFEEFLPANPGSRFLSFGELSKATVPDMSPLTSDQVKMLAGDWLERQKANPSQMPAFARSGNRYFSAAESFGIFARELAADGRASIDPHSVYGPPQIAMNQLQLRKTFSGREVMDAAAQMAPAFSDEQWKPMPSNKVPVTVRIGSVDLIPAVFLRLMAEACLDPDPAKTFTSLPVGSFPALGFLYPNNTGFPDNGLMWTWKPAPLHITAVSAK